MGVNPAPPALEGRNINVKFGDVVALSEVSVSFVPGLVHAVVGQNGAGKTTFARVAAGLIKSEPGEVLIHGRAVQPGRVTQARSAGVELVHQSFALPPSFTVAEAMEFGAQNVGQLFTAGSLTRRWTEHLSALDIKVDPRRRIRDLPVETQQAVEIARALVTDAKVLILDEPTAVLPPSGIDRLFERVRRLKARGLTVILILHKIREVLAIADTVTVLRGGRLIAATLPKNETGSERLAELIIGSAGAETVGHADAAAAIGVGTPGSTPVGARASGPAVLAMSKVSTRPQAEAPLLSDVSLVIAPGEIVGVAGVEGNGQRTLVQAIANLSEISQGNIVLDGQDVTSRDLAHRRALGLRIIPFERNTEGLSLSSSLWENWSSRQMLGRSLLSYVNPARLRRDSDTALKTWDVRYASASQPARSLSGGNAQKVILAREVDADARFIIAAQPTRGLDIGATAFVWKSLRDARDRGCAILLISSDLDELFDIADRVVVMLSGGIAGTFMPPYDIGRIGEAMTGAGR